MELQPIGTEFKKEYPPQLSSTDSRWSRVTFMVVSHMEVNDFGNIKLLEELEDVDILI